MDGQRSRVGWAIAASLLAVVLCCGGPGYLVHWLTTPESGDHVARQRIELVAGQIESQLGYRDRQRDAETIAADLVASRERYERGDFDATMVVEPVAWAGRVTGTEVAHIDVRFTAWVLGNTESWGRGWTGGSAVACYRYRLQYYRYTTSERVDCPDVGTAPIPVAEVIPELPADTHARLEAVLLAATPESLAADTRAAFPEEFVTVDTAAAGGELVAAVGVPAERDCLVLVRDPAGAVRVVSYDRVWIEPGETGCTVGLYLSPPG